MEEDNDDQWLYGDDTSEKPAEDVTNAAEPVNEDPSPDSTKEDHISSTTLEPPVIERVFVENEVPGAPGVDDAPLEINREENVANEESLENGDTLEEKEEKKKSDDEEEEDDDNINVVIGDIRTGPNYTTNVHPNLHAKRGNLLTLTKQGKFDVEDFESTGVINTVPAHDFNLDSLEEKPWRKPGADITDYFNYGFNEETWRAYCERQRRMRVQESGSGILPMMQQPAMSISTVNSNMPNSGSVAPMPGSINVVMTSERREVKKNFPDMGVPPPVVPQPYNSMPPGPPPNYPMNQYGGPQPGYFAPEIDPYYQHSFEPVQNPNWNGQNWNANVNVNSVIQISNGSDVPGKSSTMNGGLDSKADASTGGVKIKSEPEDRDDRGGRDYDRESRHRHRHRSRSRSHDRRRKHKSRSRSGHRSHKKKKSKKSDRRSKSESE